MSAHAGHPRATLQRGDTLLRVRAEGQGRPVLVLGSSVYYPRTFSPALRQHCELIFADLRHFARAGVTEKSALPTLADYVADIEAVRLALGIDRLILLGHSHHGNMAMEYARRHPHRVSHLVLIGTPPGDVATTMAAAERYWQAFASPARKRHLARQRAALNAGPCRGEQDFVAAYVADGPRYWYQPGYDAAWLWRGVPLNPHALSAFKGFFRDHDFPKVAAELSMPVLAVTGRHDYVVPPTLWEGREHLLPDLRLHVLDRSGHTPQLEEPERFETLFLDWLETAMG